MIAPPVPVDEADRLLNLQCLRILDTQPEERFDRVTRLARRMFGVDICLVSLVDSDRQWFKSRQGLDAAETSREISFCGHAILNDDILIVNDTLKDVRFADNPLVTGDPEIRFYAGRPIRGPNGFPVGTLCLIDREPRDFAQEDKVCLNDLAGMVEDQLAVAAQAAVDELTQVVNRRGFDMVATQILAVCKRTNTEAELLFFDLDGFKAVNDEFGHQAGDKMLRRFAAMLNTCFRDSDIVARLGGDEFVVLLTGSALCAQTALKRLSDIAYNSNAEHHGDLRWSVGSVRFDPLRHRSLDALLADADARMYDDKRCRKMQVASCS